MKKTILYTIEEDLGKRLDIYLSENLNMSRNEAQSLIKRELVSIIHYQHPKPSTKIPSASLKIEVEIPPVSIDDIVAENIPLDIIFEDDDVIVINKSPDMVVHPDQTHKTGTLVNAVLYHTKLSSVGGIVRPGVVHRLDKNTSGVLIMAKNNKTHAYLSDQFSLRLTKKTYIALVHGKVKHKMGTIDAPITRSQHNRQKMGIATGNNKGKPAISHFEVMKIFPATSLLKVNIETGRTHQIRVHMASIEHPVVGDHKYTKGKRDKKLEEDIVCEIPRIFLHAEKLEITLPSEEKKVFVAPLPEDLFEFLKRVEK